MKFIVTKELGKLARWLRILGFDTIYFTSDNIGTLIIESLQQDRTIVTRRKERIGHLQKKTVVISSEKLQEQLKEVVKASRVSISQEKMFSRCTICNAPLQKVGKENIKKFIPAYVYKTQNNFMYCARCKKAYWQGSHWGNVRRYAEELLPKTKNQNQK